MPYVIATPEAMAAAAADLATIGCTLDEAHAAAAPATVAVAPAAADEVSTAFARLFSRHADDYHAAARQAAAVQLEFVQNLKASTTAYTNIEYYAALFLNVLKSITIENIIDGLSQLFRGMRASFQELRNNS